MLSIFDKYHIHKILLIYKRIHVKEIPLWPKILSVFYTVQQTFISTITDVV